MSHSAERRLSNNISEHGRVSYSSCPARTAMATTTEQSLAVFYSTSPFLISQLSHHLSLAEHETGLELAAQAEFIDEELEEAGLEPEGAGQEDSKHWAVVLKGQHAVKKTRELLLGSANAGAGVSQRER